MKVTYRMIDKQLRIKGFLMNKLVASSTEDKFIKTMHNRRKQTARYQGKGIDGTQFSEQWIERRDGEKLRICIYRPLHVKTTLPVVLWLHGGGYAQGVPELFAAMYKRLIEASDCIVIAPDYRLSIDAPYPAALDDCYDTLLWLKDNAQELGICDDQIMVGGESAGGGLTAATTLLARDTGEVNIAFQMPLYPMIDDRQQTISATHNNAPIWNSDLNDWAWKLYLGELYGKDVPAYAAPARANDYENLPPTVTFVGDIEPFRDETIAYVENLRKANIPVDFEIYPGCYHGFDIMNPKADVTKKAMDFLINSFKFAVGNYFAEQPKKV